MSDAAEIAAADADLANLQTTVDILGETATEAETDYADKVSQKKKRIEAEALAEQERTQQAVKDELEK